MLNKKHVKFAELYQEIVKNDYKIVYKYTNMQRMAFDVCNVM